MRFDTLRITLIGQNRLLATSVADAIRVTHWPDLALCQFKPSLAT